jgi:hypothetical protein
MGLTITFKYLIIKNMKKKKKKFERLNLYLDMDLAEAIREHAKRDYLRKTTWVTQFLRKNLLVKNNAMSNPVKNED